MNGLLLGVTEWWNEMQPAIHFLNVKQLSQVKYEIHQQICGIQDGNVMSDTMVRNCVKISIKDKIMCMMSCGLSDHLHSVESPLYIQNQRTSLGLVHICQPLTTLTRN